MGLICILHMSKLTNKEGTRQQQTLCSGQWSALHTSYVQMFSKAAATRTGGHEKKNSFQVIRVLAMVNSMQNKIHVTTLK
jgi:hypothetical protein